MVIKIWNKTDNINGVNPEIVLKQKPEFREDEVILICKDDAVYEMHSCSVLKDVYKISESLTPEEIGCKYLSIIKDLENNMNDDYHNIRRVLTSLINSK